MKRWRFDWRDSQEFCIFTHTGFQNTGKNSTFWLLHLHSDPLNQLESRDPQVSPRWLEGSQVVRGGSKG